LGQSEKEIISHKHYYDGGVSSDEDFGSDFQVLH
jgi:hypothetical protein